MSCMCKAVRTVDDLGFILISTFGKVLQIFYINKMIPATCLFHRETVYQNINRIETIPSVLI